MQDEIGVGRLRVCIAGGIKALLDILYASFGNQNQVQML